jgi:hypothetical protein
MEVTTASSEQWRRYGEARREELVKQDELCGGTEFQISGKHRIQKYFDVIDKVSANK